MGALNGSDTIFFQVYFVYGRVFSNYFAVINDLITKVFIYLSIKLIITHQLEGPKNANYSTTDGSNIWAGVGCYNATFSYKNCSSQSINQFLLKKTNKNAGLVSVVDLIEFCGWCCLEACKIGTFCPRNVWCHFSAFFVQRFMQILLNRFSSCVGLVLFNLQKCCQVQAPL